MGPLLERDDELGTLAGLVERAASGRGCLALIGGEAGIGKTSLIRALRARVGDRAAFLAGSCEPLSVPVPLAPLRELVEAAGGGDLLRTDDRLELTGIVLAALAGRAPAVAVVEDLHWADPLTLDLLRILARRVEDAPVAMVATYRDDEVGANPPLGLLLGDLATRPAVRRISLRPLSDAAVRELAAPAGLDAAELVRVTGGNPFLVAEAAAAGRRLPATVRDAALARAARLSPAGRGVVDVAAVIGPRFDPALLRAVAPDSAAAAEEALARGVLVADGAVLGFRHELIREALEDSISPPRRAELHARVLAALAERPGAADAALLAHHAELGGLPAEACRYAARAAEEAERVGALHETRLQAERALRLGADLPAEQRLELLIRAARAANFASTDLAAAGATAGRAVALAEALGDPVRLGRALVAHAWTLWSLDRVDEAIAAAERAIAALEPAGDAPALARARSTHVRMHATALDPEVALAGGPGALALAEETGLEEVRLEVAISVALAHGHAGRPDALPMLDAALAGARAAGLAIQTVRTYVNLVFVAALLRDHARVDAATREALAFFGEAHATIPGYAVESYLARSLLDRGRWDEALATFARTDRDWVSETPVVRAFVGILQARRGVLGGAALVERAWRELAEVPESSRHAAVRVAHVETAWLDGDTRAAARRLHEARESAALRFARPSGDLAVWGRRCGVPFDPPAQAPEAVHLEAAGDWRRAIRAWRELEAPYEAALAALPGDDRAANDALAAFHRLGASAAARAFVRDRAARGGVAARGPRRSTLANPGGLTRREQEVLERLATGATNAAMAAALHLSERTVAHHVSAILAKLGAANRVAAVERARTRGLLAQDGPPDPPT